MEPFSFHLIPWNTHGEAQHDSINNPLHLFNGSFQNFLLSHILQFINVTLPFAMFAASSGTHESVRLRTIRARDAVLVHLRSLFFSPTPYLPRPTPQSCHRICQRAECGTRTLAILFQVVVSAKRAPSPAAAPPGAQILHSSATEPDLSTLTAVNTVPLECGFCSRTHWATQWRLAASDEML